MIDIHTHILPGIDDGARQIQDALQLLAHQRSCGVDGIYLTPHFYPEETRQEDFFLRRDRAWSELMAAVSDEERTRIRLGAEVHYTPRLLELDIQQLTLGKSDYLLLELPYQRYPAYVEQVAAGLQAMGITPVLAHVERFPYFRKDPGLLKRLINRGALGQVSADALFSGRDKGFARACLTNDLAQIVASDAHNLADRKPAMDRLAELPEWMQQKTKAFTQAIWENEPPLPVWPAEVRKTFLGYR